MTRPQSSARPLTIAHRAGNHLPALAEAFAAGVDYVEVDVWLYRGRLEVRHEKTAGPLPILWDRWCLKAGWKPRLQLNTVLAQAAGTGKLFLDLKGKAGGTADAVAKAVTQAGLQDTVAFTTPVWGHLDRLAGRFPKAPLFYTAGTPEKLAALRPRLGRREIQAVSIDADILTESIVAELKAAGVGTIATWHVNTAEQARKVLGWGATGVNSDSLPLLISILEGRIGPDGG